MALPAEHDGEVPPPPADDAVKEAVVPLPWKTRICFALGGAPIALLSDVPGLFISPYLLETVLISPGTLGQMFLGAKIFDAVVDPFIGIMTDRTRSRYGRRKPWMVFALLLAILSNTLLWHTLPPTAAYGAKVGYYFVWLCLVALSVTLFLVPYSSMTTEVTLVDAQRAQLTEGRSALNFLSTLIGVMVVGLFVDTLFVDQPTMRYFYANIVVTLLVSGAIASVVFGVHAPHDLPHSGAGERSFKAELAWTMRAFRGIIVQREFWSLASVATINWMAVYLLQNNLKLYVDYCTQLPSMFTPLMVVALVSSVAWVFLWRFIVRWKGKKTVLFIGQASLLVTYVCVAVAPAENVPFLMVIAVFTGLSLSSVNLLPWMLLPDVIDFDEHRSGERREGVSTSFIVLFYKTSIGLALAVSGFVLEAGGYDNSEGIPEYTEEIDRTLRLLTGVMPAVMVLLTIPFVFLYPITPERHADVLEEIARRRQKGGDMSQSLLAGVSMDVREHSPLLGDNAE
mgnify:CR=1 FL=1